VAGGFEMVLACDLVVAGSGALFGLPEVKRGLIAAGGGLLLLRDRIPYNVALELALLGSNVGSDRMRELGLINRVVSDGGALAAAEVLAAEMAANAPLSLLASKRIFVEAQSWPVGQRWQRQHDIAWPVANSDDAREGATAFLHRRPPRWRGR
jgi:enoyl-CoA hydratase